jgi:two-component system, NtrC family, sensor kinase
MKETFILFLLISLCPSQVMAQRLVNIDSLHSILATTKTDTTRSQIMNLLSSSYRFSNPDSAVFYGNKAFELSKKIGFIKGEVAGLANQGLAFVWLGNLPKALELAFKALEIGQNAKHTQGIPMALSTIGMVNFELKNYRKAIHYYRLQQIESKVTNNFIGLAYGLTDIGEVLAEMNQLDSAEYYQHKAIEIFGQISSVDPVVYNRLGDIEMKRLNSNLAKDYYHQSLRTAFSNDERRSISQSYLKLASLFNTLNMQDSAIYYAKNALAVAETIEQKKVMLGAAYTLSELHEVTDANESLRYYKKASNIKESMFGAGNLQVIQVLIANEEQRQDDMEKAEASFQNRSRINALMGISFTLFIIAFFLVRNNRYNKKAKKKVEKAYDQLKSTQTQLIHSEKMASLGELTAGIAHEIQNPLNFVNNFSEVSGELLAELKEELEKGDMEEVKAISEDIIQNLEKINHHGQRASGIVKGMLEHSRTGDGTKELTDINKLADEYLRLSYHGLRAKEKGFNADFTTEFDRNLPKTNVVTQDIGRVLLNLINNAFQVVSSKALVTEDSDYKPKVEVSTKLLGDKIEIRVKDNGSGIPDDIKDKIFEPFFTTKPTGQGTGLGLSMSYDIITKGHGGGLKVESKVGEGSIFTIQLTNI